MFRSSFLVLSVIVHTIPVVLTENTDGVMEPPNFRVRVIIEASFDTSYSVIVSVSFETILSATNIVVLSVDTDTETCVSLPLIEILSLLIMEEVF